jgi:hypothetical protein
VVLYHAISLWVPAIGGTYGFLRLRRSMSEGPPAVASPSGDEAVRDGVREREPRGALAN